jgi:hypothetical protein
VSFQFTDEDGSKLRPDLVVSFSERHEGVRLAVISSKLNSPPNDDELDFLSDRLDFAMTSLKVFSRLRLNRMKSIAIV